MGGGNTDQVIFAGPDLELAQNIFHVNSKSELVLQVNKKQDLMVL